MVAEAIIGAPLPRSAKGIVQRRAAGCPVMGHMLDRASRGVSAALHRKREFGLRSRPLRGYRTPGQRSSSSPGFSHATSDVRGTCTTQSRRGSRSGVRSSWS
jgi:hypothetical protein